MERFKNRWIFFGRNWIREEPEPTEPIRSGYRQMLLSTARRIRLKVRQLSPGNLLMTLILRDVAHF